jgi:Na+-transporting methylmalonyl-CoA/oxaloacetate decarboxylase beta subunit
VLLKSLTVGNAFNTLYIETSNISLILKVLTVVFKSISGAFIDTLASVMLIIASVRAISQENAEPLPKHQITATLSKTLGIAAIVVVAMIILSVLFSVFITFADGNSGSIGIIGGADGPTAWFITQTLIFGSFGTHFISCLCLAVASIVLKIVSNKQKAEA